MPWRLHWSTAGHPPPLLLTPDGRAEYLYAEPGLPLGVETSLPRPDHTRLLPGGATVVLFTDGLVEHRDHLLDTGLEALAAIATPAIKGRMSASAALDRLDPNVARTLPTHAANRTHAILVDVDFWTAQRDAATERFNRWVVG